MGALSLFASCTEPEIKNELAVDLYPFQREDVLYLHSHPKCIVASEMGTGKTMVALAKIEADNAYPCVVVAPSSNKFTWAEKEIPKALPHRLILVADKNTKNPNLFALADIIVTNYEQLVGFRTTESGRRSSHTDHTKKKVILSDLAKKLQSMDIKSVILDEGHKIKTMSSSLTRAVLSTFMWWADGTPKDIPIRLVLTGTPFLNRPAEGAAYLRFLGYLQTHFNGHFEYLKRYCGLRKGKWGLEAKAALNSKELNEKLRALGYIRRLKKDVLPDLPPKSRTSLIVEIDNRKEYEHAEEELIEWVQKRVDSDKEFLDSIAHLSPSEKDKAIHDRKHDKAKAARRAETIVRISALRRVASEGKVKAAIQWIKDFLETEEKLVVFAIHRNIIDELLKAFPNAARIVSDDPSEERYKNVQRFQSDAACRLVVGALGTSAGSSPAGVGHTLTSAPHVLFLELGWNPALHDQAEDRCHRIGQQDNVTCHYFVGKRTIDEKLVSIIESKRKTLKTISDGIEGDDEVGIMEEITDWLLEGK